MRKLLIVTPFALMLAGCPLNDVLAPAPSTGYSSGAAAAPAAPMNVGTFLNRVEAARGTALTVAEKSQVTVAAQQTRNLVDGAQQKFLGAVGGTIGLDAATVGLLFPNAAQPVSAPIVQKALESKLGKQLSGFESTAVNAAATLRNNSLNSLKGNLATKVGSTVGLPGDVVLGLLPLLGL
ncbi:MAG TPA: hypothetical protein PKY03_04130 [Moraxellaceae bacterium]|nr:hypothetical protein [Moraxellaceae bacterium]